MNIGRDFLFLVFLAILAMPVPVALLAISKKIFWGEEDNLDHSVRVYQSVLLDCVSDISGVDLQAETRNQTLVTQ